MTLCREWTLTKDLGELRYAKPLPCRSWNCDLCRPMRKDQLMALAASGEPLRFLTLTVSPAVGSSQEERLRMLAHAWRTAVKRLRRLYGPESVEYLAIVEETKAGEPHLHILLRSKYLPQRTLSAIMGQLLGSPIVDIRAIKSQRELIRYVAKYITKAPKQFGSAKRYWASSHYSLDKESFRKAHPESMVRWELVKEPIRWIVERWVHESFAVRQDHGEVLIGIKTNYRIGERGIPPDGK